MGAEIAVHSYDHVDLKAISPEEASQQLVRAAQTFKCYGINVYGFRCPYLSFTDELVDVLPRGLFFYSSNIAIQWDGFSFPKSTNVSNIFNTINQFYQPRSALEKVCVPWTRSNITEIPVCVPDDLQLFDGLCLSPEEIAQFWSWTLHQTYERGELFTPLFHPELALICQRPFERVLHKARQFHPKVWITRLRDISDWWREKSSFTVDSCYTPAGLHLSFTCSPRATILIRGLDSHESTQPWDAIYSRLMSFSMDISAVRRPFIGLPAETPSCIVSFLREQGYILDGGETATQCSIYLDSSTQAKLANEVALVEYIETSRQPLVRYWRWPDGAKSAISISGDLDALSLFDYVSRLSARK